jgi:hypothetical protein
VPPDAGAPVATPPPAAKKPAKAARRRNDVNGERAPREERAPGPAGGRYPGYADAHGGAVFPWEFMGWPR